MMGRRRAFAVDGRDGTGEGLARGCIVPGVTSTYRRIPDAAHGCSSWERGDKLRGVSREALFLKLASRDSGVEMAVGDSPLAALPGLPQDSLDFESSGSPEPPAHVDQLLASQKLGQVLERSHRLPTAPTSLSGQHRCLRPPSKCKREVPLFGAGEQESMEADTDLEAGLEEEAVGGLGPGAWACLPGQGLRYLEHLCLVLEQMARLQQLYLQLRIQRPPGDPGEELARAPLPSPLHTPGNGGQRPWEVLSQTEQTGEGPSCLPLSCMPGVPLAGPLSRSLMGCLLALANLILFLKGQRLLHPQRWRCPVPTLPGCQKPQWSQRTTCHPPRDTRRLILAVVTAVSGSLVGGLSVGRALGDPSSSAQRDFSHWDKVKVLLNRICRRSHHHPEPPTPPDGSDPRIESRDLPERPQCRPHRKTFMPSLVVKKQRAQNLSVG
ncbi:uncharacterized protein C8orf58 homolog isoform X1 [Piliocolobus tephrosceles]|uniref:uncharacterized protein C8orf58 homolog isoform X1 n=1 Tax=Piliocolobus tephrosceles TaxID=591936 RepID=UPI000C2B0C26|nr:uncharacterized protein C8orf58 homolog isoform X1 [Piliocolobus tephrosceles]